MGSFKDELVKKGLLSPDDAKRLASEQARSAADAKQRAREDAEEEFAAKHIAAAPRYPGARPVALAAVRALFEPYGERFAELQRAAEIDGVLDPEIFTLPSAQQIDGDLVVDELALPREGSNLIVRGNLTVRAILHQEFRAGGLVVLGNLHARHIVTDGSILCTGHVDVPGVLYGTCTNYETDVLGRATVGTLVSVKEHLFAFWGEHHVASVVDASGGAPNLELYAAPDSRALRVADLYDVAAVLAALRDHDNIFL